MTEPPVDNDSEHNFPKGFLQLFSEAKISDPYEGLVILLHTFMLEVEYTPKDVDEAAIYESMPENWKVGGIFNLLYYYKSISEVSCRVTCVPLYSNLAIHGLLEGNENVDSNVYLKVKVNSKGNASDPSSLLPYLKELSILFKDRFCFPLLVLLQESVNYKPSFGLSGLINEAKFIILTFLPVESVVSMSAVNKDFHDQVNSSYLWKCLFSRDYGTDHLDSGSSTSEDNWKEKYKTEYLKRQRKPRAVRSRFMPYYVPEVYPIRSDFHNDVDLRIDMDPALQQAFPLMRNRFRPSYWLFPGGGNSFNPWFY